MIKINEGVGSKIISKIVSKLVKKKLGINGNVLIDALEIDNLKNEDGTLKSMDMVNITLRVRMSLPMTDIDKLVDKF